MGLEWEDGPGKPPSDKEILFWLVVIIVAITAALAMA